MDVYTETQFVKLSIPDANFVELKIKNRNLSSEFPYIEEVDGDNENIVVNLGDLQQFARVQGSDSYRHVKLEIQYTLINPNFTKFYSNLIYQGSFGIDEFIHPEFYITVPLGRNIRKNGDLFTIFLKKGEYEEELRLEGPYRNRDNGKNKYSYLINYEDYLKIKEEDNEKIRFEIVYEVSFDKELFLPFLFAILLLFLSVFQVLYPLLIISLSLFVAVMTLSKEGFDIPLKAPTLWIVLISLVLYPLVLFINLLI